MKRTKTGGPFFRTVIRANPVQKANRRLTENFRKVVKYDPTVTECDFIAGRGTFIFFLSYRYYATDRTYLTERVFPTARKADCEQTVLLLVVDVPTPDEDVLTEINVLAFGEPVVLMTVLRSDTSV